MSTAFQQSTLQQPSVTFPSVEKSAVLHTESFDASRAHSPVVMREGQALDKGFGTIQLKPICIEQEPVTFRPGPMTIQQPPLVVQGETVTVPQPPIVIHPEPIVIPQAPLTFTPQAITMPRPPITVQPEAVTLARPSYSVQPLIQYDLRGCNTFGRADLSQHVRVKLTNEQAGINSTINTGGPALQAAPLMTASSAPVLQSAPLPAAAPVKADSFSYDRNYNYGLPPSGMDKFKDSLGVANIGPEKLQSGYYNNNTTMDSPRAL
jgi:hypothetical protein